MSEPRSGAARQGLAASLRRLLATALEIGQVRLELLGTEIEQQKLRAFSALAWAAFGILLLGLALVMLAGLLLMLFWESHRLVAAALLTLAFLAAGVLALRLARERVRTPAGAFAASAAELARDRAALGDRSAAPPP